MKILSPSAHGIIDVCFITFVALAPVMFDLEPAIDTACFVLAGGYLLVTLLTDFRLGLLRLIPFPVHGWLDLLTGVALAAAPFLFHFEANSDERNLFLGLGIFSIIVWLITDWKAQTRSLITDNG
ncbi:SPW repeat domain-containing protein [Hymenobacter cellulosivorans]|uniref:SPW repeat-containing protein n=1 Tax=Hymenobacter cellulosivorans TaxID=2932249 RepID=A0ABY4FBQ8_9BACT|nr:hypothetical protein [Hymenobacter cellulosivorans]UOQ53448.1 hypothetical protein MUN80_01505 [Hymenobacter cellulosivorans]